MLNTKQSNQKKSWKYVLILPVLSAFMLLFQVETVAQVKENPIVKTSSVVSTNYTSIVTRNTTNQELKEVEASFSDENQKLIISNVKRNKKGEIIEIKLLFDTGKTYYRVMERISKEPIDPIEIFVKTDKEGNKDCGFEEIDLSAIYAEEIFEVKNIPQFKELSLDNLPKNGKDVILIINGKIKGATEKVKIPVDEELGEMKEISAAEFEKKYNQKAAKNNLYYEVETYKLKTFTGSWKDAMKDSKEGEENKPNSIKSFKENEAGNSEKSNSNKYNVTIEFDELGERNQIKKSKEHKNVDYKKALLIFDGKEINLEELEKINPNTISSFNVSKTSLPNLLEKYGERAKNGVIEIESVEYYAKNNPSAKKNETETLIVKFSDSVDGFIITKRDKTKELVFYQNVLGKNKIIFSFDKVKRDDNGLITSIRITLEDSENKITKNFKAKKGIEEIFIGRAKGKLIIK